MCLAGIRICYVFKVFLDRIKGRIHSYEFLWFCDYAIDMYARGLVFKPWLLNETLN